MISFPQYATVGDLRAALNSQVGFYNPALYRLFIYDNGQYIEITQVNLGTDLMGKGLFAVSRFGPSVTLPSPDVSYFTTFSVRVVTLTPGWNLLSYPFLGGSAGDFNSVSISQFRDMSFTLPATSSGLVYPLLFEFIGNVYQPTTNMIPGNAYWIFNQTSGPLYLQFQQSLGKRRFTPTPTISGPAISPPPPPGAKIGENMGCGLLGLEGILLALAASSVRRFRSRRRLGA